MELSLSPSGLGCHRAVKVCILSGELELQVALSFGMTRLHKAAKYASAGGTEMISVALSWNDCEKLKSERMEFVEALASDSEDDVPISRGE
nr:hypothetical protein Iba_chr01bCG0680 [Ipomoea batatas]